MITITEERLQWIHDNVELPSEGWELYHTVRSLTAENERLKAVVEATRRHVEYPNTTKHHELRERLAALDKEE